jgi:hypothetical protein
LESSELYREIVRSGTPTHLRDDETLEEVRS